MLEKQNQKPEDLTKDIVKPIEACRSAEELLFGDCNPHGHKAAYWIGLDGYHCRRLNFPKECRGAKQPSLPTNATMNALIQFLKPQLLHGKKFPKRTLELARVSPKSSEFLAIVTEPARKRSIALGLRSEKLADDRGVE